MGASTEAARGQGADASRVPGGEPFGQGGGLHPLTMPVAERFVSVNGEGAHAGRLATFLRFAGCNLSCSYCDTAWANAPGCPVEQLSVEELAAFAREAETPCVTLTGGEPLLQPLLLPLLRALLGDAAAPARFVEIETNGAVDVREVAQLRDELGLRGAGALGLTMDYKGPSSGEEPSMLTGNFAYLTCDDVVKFVVGSAEDLRVMQQVVERFGLCERCAVYASPVFGAMEPADIVEFVKERSLTGVTVQLQLHKIIWPACERGV
ncbi:MULTISPECIES: putative 7-carboxy-7-deazaguanine synthase QueE [unclassified Adlercreutzia]|uniref:putative 7-carboxy-7-deazaguanine synthase QueE n=1 Tax=unclassified Adlercreutzia TaxID=2636013 RepID=UPI00197CCA7F|nr:MULTISPECIES: putative 7-carboxy-7-deazaguanine synthase QueE [unclassified Adlercreutzia]